MNNIAGADSPAQSPLPLPTDDILIEILLRLPPEPIYLFRASFVSKHWRSLVHDARFIRRFRESHGGKPPVLGFFNQQGPPLFIPTSGSRGFALCCSATITPHHVWWLYDCRNGRAIVESYRSRTLLVWDLMTGDQRYLPLPAEARRRFNCAVLCAAGHADDHDCHSCPFLVVLVFTRHSFTSACVYWSEAGVWSETTSIYTPRSSIHPKQTALVGNTLYFLLADGSIVGFNLDKHSLRLIEDVPSDCYNQIVIMPADDGLLGFAGADGFSLRLWSMVDTVDGVVTWTNHRVIDMGKLLPPKILGMCRLCPGLGVEPIGYAEDANAIFIDVYSSVYMIYLKSMKTEEVSGKKTYANIFPYTSFYTPGIMTGGGDDQAEKQQLR